MTALYNEIDPKAAAWLRALIDAGHIAPGIVDERSIEDLTPDYLLQFTQVHFFAGIGVWSYALRAAGWPDDRPVWTGSCPCQPFSAAGKGGGFDDERHLWPAFHWLIEQCQPPVVFGEQVASKDGLGWLDLVQADLEGTGYASGAVDLCAAGVGAPHIRQRLWWFGERVLAHSDRTGSPAHTGDAGQIGGVPQTQREPEYGAALSGRGSGLVGLANDAEQGRVARGRLGVESDGRGSARVEPGRLRDAGGMANSAGTGPFPGAHAGVHSGKEGAGPRHAEPERPRANGGVADYQSGGRREEQPNIGRGSQGTSTGEVVGSAGHGRNSRSGPTNGLWGDADWLHCRDGKWRPVEPGTFPLAHGAAERVGRLRGYGNAIVAPAAQAFIEAYLDATVI